MNNIDFIKDLQYLYMDFLPYILKMFFLGISTFYTFINIINNKKFFNLKLTIISIFIFLISICSSILKYNFNFIVEICCLVFILSILFSIVTKNKFTYSLTVTIISFSINYIIFIIAVAINFLPNVIFNLRNDYIRLVCIISIHIVIMHFIFKIPKLKYGFTFLKNNANDTLFEVLILNVSIILIFVSLILNITNYFLSQKLLFAFLILCIIMFITIKKSFEIYYKQNLLIKELQETKELLRQKQEEIINLENENLNLSKVNHSIVHKQNSLEFKLNELIQKSETSSELDIRDRINAISNTYLNQSAINELPKIDVAELDNMLKFMQSECVRENIDFELQILGNIHYMVNNFIDKENLEILLADFIKNSIIAITHSNNVNRSILVKLGIIEGFYSLYIYDSGIEFEIDTLLSLGLKPCTTHVNNGGSGIGFMNTFDTLRKYNASIIINELNPPSRDNYTKVIIIKFDKQNTFKINSYRSKEIKEHNINSNFIIE